LKNERVWGDDDTRGVDKKVAGSPKGERKGKRAAQR